MRTITPLQIKSLEKEIFSTTPMTAGLLMEKAAFEVVNYIKQNYGLKKVLFLCGPGNNGGDGFAAARLYKTDGGQPVIWKFKSSQSPLCKTQENLINALWPQVLQEDLPKEMIEEKLSSENYVCIVDALFGTGLSKPLSNEIANIVEAVNKSGIPVIAVDIPSGVEGENGISFGSYIKATTTVTFHRPKKGLYFNQGVNGAGDITVCPIGIPPALDMVPGIEITDCKCIQSFLGLRNKNSHKGDFGKILIVAGHLGMAGAAIFAAQSALNAGGGLVTVACSEEITPILQQTVPEAMCIPMPTKSTTDTKRTEVFALTCDTVVFGPGLGREQNWEQLVQFLSNLNKPVVWDADGLFYLNKYRVASLPPFHVLTPHPGEAAMLLDTTVKAITADPVSAAEQIQKKIGASVILKGAKSLLFDGMAFGLNPTGTPALAKGGSGDVLSGLLGALLGRKDYIKSPSTMEIMQTACFILGLTGEYGVKEKGENGLLPSDIIKQIPYAMQDLIGK